MFEMMTVILAGFLLGLRHASEPDHVIAISAILSREKDPRRAALYGLYWGLGHTLTIFVIGSILILLKLTIPHRIGEGMELSVAVMLVVLGVLSLREILRRAPTASESNPLARLDLGLQRSRLYARLRPFVVGIIHGLAGSAALILFVLSIIPDPRWALAYLLVFGVGTIAGMMLVTVVLAGATHTASSRFPAFQGWLKASSGAVSIVLGVVIAWRTISLIR